MNTKTYDDYFETLYDSFIEETSTEEFEKRNEQTEKLESLLYMTAKKFYDLGQKQN